MVMRSEVKSSRGFVWVHIIIQTINMKCQVIDVLVYPY